MIKFHLLLLLFFHFSFCQCDGFNWHHDIKIEDCNQNDIDVLNEFIDNGSALNEEMDVNFNGKIDVIELGWQLWENGRLIHWICNDVPSPWYIYDYNCNLSGKIPSNIENLDALVKLDLSMNLLQDKIPNEICNLNISSKSKYWFNIENNRLCPEYPDCIQKSNKKQNIDECFAKDE